MRNQKELYLGPKILTENEMETLRNVGQPTGEYTVEDQWKGFMAAAAANEKTRGGKVVVTGDVTKLV